MASSNDDKDGREHNGHSKIANPVQPRGGGAQHGSKQHEKTVIARAKQLWAKTGITLPVYELMFKGALAPLIGIAAYQSIAWGGALYDRRLPSRRHDCSLGRHPASSEVLTDDAHADSLVMPVLCSESSGTVLCRSSKSQLRRLRWTRDWRTWHEWSCFKGGRNHGLQLICFCGCRDLAIR